MRKTLAQRLCLLSAASALLACAGWGEAGSCRRDGKVSGTVERGRRAATARLFVANLDARQVVVLDVAQGRVAARLAMPAEPSGMVLSPDGSKLYVTCCARRAPFV